MPLKAKFILKISILTRPVHLGVCWYIMLKNNLLRQTSITKFTQNVDCWFVILNQPKSLNSRIKLAFVLFFFGFI